MSERAQLVAVAEAVAAGLRAADFVPRGTVVRGYMTKHNLEDGAIAIGVFPRKSRSIRVSRGGPNLPPLKQADLDINVWIFKRLVGSDQERDGQVDELLLLTERIEDYFDTHPLPGRSEAQTEANTDANGDVNFSPEALVSRKEFETTLTLTFRGTRKTQ